ncbi:hypothetical protein BJ546DRAFT_989256 [Cryomyces antarcticus]
MRLFPPPHEGLHPRYPKAPEPLPASDVVLAPVVGGSAGALMGLARFVFRRPKPGSAFRVATFITLTYGGLAAFTDHWLAPRQARRYFEREGIKIPAPVLWERSRTVCSDDYIVAGAVAGLGLLAIKRNRVIPQSALVKVLGAMSIGSFAANVVFPIGRREQLQQARLIHQMQQDQTLDFMPPEQRKLIMDLRARFSPSAILARFTQGQSNNAAPQQSGGSGWSFPGLQQVTPTKQIAVTINKDPDELDIDEQDPQPHLSLDEDGEREFIPLTNYKWSPATNEEGIRALEKHIERLQERRARRAREAEYLWHQLAEREAAYYAERAGSPSRDEKRAKLELLGSMHSTHWKDISDIDWMIADSQKNILQLRAMINKSKWIPELSRASEKGDPQSTLNELLGLREKLLASRMQIEETEQHMTQVTQGLKWGTVPVVGTDAAKNDLREVQKVQNGLKKDLELLEQLIKTADALIEETETRIKGNEE